MGRRQVPLPNVIEIKNATVYRGEGQVFAGLSLEIPIGCHTAILGPNGAGKTTLLKLLSREIYPAHREGSYVRLFGQERWNVWELRRCIGTVSHDLQHEYLGHVRGRDVILSGYYSSIDVYALQAFSAEDLERVRQIMNTLGVTTLGDRMFSEMSTGEQRRFLLGRALIHDPNTLVLDEPTSGLDLKACFQYLDIVRGLMRMGKTIILVTHHIHEIPPEISRVVLLKDGRVVGDGQKQEILTSKNLTSLFGTPVDLVHRNGWYQALPAKSLERDTA
ncbi:MAG: molybdenum ABC transporter ATP-binding protein [Nitrospiraceae bacterium]